MTTPNEKRYREWMADLRRLLALLNIEAEHAEDWRMSEGVDAADVAELNKAVALLTKAYGVLCADEDIRIADAVDMARAVTDGTHGKPADTDDQL